MSLVLDLPLSVKYNNTDLHVISGLSVLDRDVNQLPERNLRIHKLARTDGSVLTTSEYGAKTLVINGVIVLESREATEAAIDQLRGLLASPEGNIDVMVAGATRRFVGTLNSFTTALKGGYCKFSLEFICSIPFGVEIDTVTLHDAEANTASSAEFPMAIEGSYKAEPYIQITYSAITGGTDATVSVYNNADGIGLEVTRDWTTGDVLEIDGANKTVRVNGVDVARSGRFPSFLPGSRILGYSDTFTTRTMALTTTYQKRYV